MAYASAVPTVSVPLTGAMSAHRAASLAASSLWRALRAPSASAKFARACISRRLARATVPAACGFTDVMARRAFSLMSAGTGRAAL